MTLSDRGRWPQGSLVARLAEVERAALLSAGTAVKFDDDDILVLQGDVGDGLYVLTGGMVKVTVAAETGIETMLAVRSRGDLIGEFAVLDGMPRTATARAVGTVGAVRISRSAFAAFGQRYPGRAGHHHAIPRGQDAGGDRAARGGAHLGCQGAARPGDLRTGDGATASKATTGWC